MFMHKQKHLNLRSTYTETFVPLHPPPLPSLFLQDICTQYGVNFTFITHVEKCVQCSDCYSNTGHLKNNERSLMPTRVEWTHRLTTSLR